MTTKHAPATPLPWYAATRHIGSLAIPTSALFADVRQTANHDVAVQDATYIARAANAYPQLVEALRATLNHWHSNTRNMERAEPPHITNARALLRSLGEDA